jgi:hypothetical protein
VIEMPDVINVIPIQFIGWVLLGLAVGFFVWLLRIGMKVKVDG